MKETHQITISVPGAINSMQHMDITTTTACKELIDNSIDACASKIKIDNSGKDLVIKDNGKGFDDMKSILTFHSSNKPSQKGQIGKFGIGMKDCCVRFSNITKVKSRGKSITVQWDSIKKGLVTGPTITDCTHNADFTTEITLVDYMARKGKKHEISQSEIAKTYTKHLSSGKCEIVFNGKKLNHIPFPKTTNFKIDKVIEFKGKKARVYGGAFDYGDPQSEFWNGYNIFYNDRLIRGNVKDYGREDENISNICFVVELIDDNDGTWSPSTHKSDIDGVEELLNHIYKKVTKDSLIENDKKCIEVKMKDAIFAIEEKCNKGKQTRKKKENGKKGTVKPTGSGNKKKNTNTNPPGGTGVYNDRKSTPWVSIRFEQLPRDNKFCELDGGNGKKIHITYNSKHPFIKKEKENIDVMTMVTKVIVSFYAKMKTYETVPDNLISEIMEAIGGEFFEE